MDQQDLLYTWDCKRCKKLIQLVLYFMELLFIGALEFLEVFVGGGGGLFLV